MILAEELIAITVVIDADVISPRKIHIVNDEEGAVRELCRRRRTNKERIALNFLRQLLPVRPFFETFAHGQKFLCRECIRVKPRHHARQIACQLASECHKISIDKGRQGKAHNADLDAQLVRGCRCIIKADNGTVLFRVIVAKEIVLSLAHLPLL